VIIAKRWPSSPWGRPRIHLLALAAACLAGGGGCGIASTPSAVTVDRPAATPDVLIDGFAIGPARDTGSGAVFHRLEVAARGAWTRDHPGQAVSAFTTHHAGRLADGTTQPGTDEPSTYLMVIEIPGGEHHALVLHCSPLTLLDLGDCR
jgi:hypothetical protein